jgi:hypothetical protein
MSNEPIEPRPPYDFDYAAKVERKYIAEFWGSLREEEDVDYDWEDSPRKRVSTKAPEKVDLAWLLAQVPEGIKPSQIKMEFGYNASSMAFEDHYCRFYYEVKVPARKKELAEAKKKYKDDLAKYEQDLAAWRADQKAKRIRRMEADLKRLKGE